MQKKIYLTFEQVRRNKIKTVLLVFCMLLLVVAACVAFGYALGDVRQGLVYGLLFSAIICTISLFSAKFMMIQSANGIELDESSPEGRRVLRIVERVASAANIPMPKAYLLQSSAPNAFASGFSPKSAFVGVTRGLLSLLDDNELEAVIAHEVSHIANYDVLICTVGYALVSIFIAASTLRYIRIRSNDDRGNRGALIILVLILVSLVGRLVANLLNLAISRKREYIADANAVRLCANNQGLIGALTKLSSYNMTEAQVKELGGPALMGMYINNPKISLVRLFSTHPPIEERIEILKNMA